MKKTAITHKHLRNASDELQRIQLMKIFKKCSESGFRFQAYGFGG